MTTTNVKQIFSEQKFPEFIKGHGIFKTFKEVKKVFPEIGLPNTEKEIEVDNKAEVKTAATALLNEINGLIDKRLRTINKYSTKKEDDIGPKRKQKLERINKLLTGIKTSLNKAKTKCLVTNNGRTTLNLAEDILDIDGKVVFKSGEGLFRVYNKLNEVLREGHFLAMEKLENNFTFKDFSSKNVPALKYKVRFSSDGTEGLWDIATMSMRGISSCQSWGQGNATHVVGSVADPFTGIIYLTSGVKFNDYGSKMIRRCVVRFLVNKKTKKPFIGLERMYPSDEKSALNAFISFLKERTDNKFDIVYIPNANATAYQSYVPMSKIVERLSAMDQPYRDSGIPYEKDSLGVKKLYEPDVMHKLHTFYSMVAGKVLATARAMKIGGIPAESKKGFKTLIGSDYNNDISYFAYDRIIRDAKVLVSKIDPTKYNSEEAYIKDVLDSFVVNLDDRIFGSLKSSVRDRLTGIPGYIVSDDVLKAIATESAVKITKQIGMQVKKIKIPEGDTATKEEVIIPAYKKFLA